MSAKDIRIEIVARALYRELMGGDFDEFPWDDDNLPSNETVEEAEHFAEIAVSALDSNYKTDDVKFDKAVKEAAWDHIYDLMDKLKMK